MKILVVEDDAETLAYVSKGLQEAGHSVDASSDGLEGLELAETRDYEVAVLDRMLPGKDGLLIAKALRVRGSPTRILFLTSLGGIDDRVEGFNAGGDDYLIKPFAFSELAARVKALGRRPKSAEVITELHVGDLVLDLLKRSVTRAGQVVEIQPRELRLLEYMMQNVGRVLTRTMLLERVWDLHFDPKTNIVETHMSRLRSKIDGPFDTHLIQTVRGSGYKIDVPR